VRLAVSFALLALLAAPTACTRPPAPVQPLQHVSESAKLRVKFNAEFPEPWAGSDDQDPESLKVVMEGRRAIVEQLRAAGYEIVEHGQWDVKMGMSVSVGRYRNFDPEYKHAEVTFVDHHNQVVDRIAFDMLPGAAPAGEPKRVANAVVESKKLAAYAEERNAKRAPAKPAIDDESRRSPESTSRAVRRDRWV
jgi:hypothetical protein